MANTVRITATTQDNASSPLDRIRDKLTKVQAQGAKGFAIGAGAAITAAGIGLVSSAIDGVGRSIGNAVTDASELQQATGAIESVLGSASAKVKAFGETSAQSYGLSREQVARLGAVTSAQLQGMGFSANQAADQTINLQKRAADMAATFGGTVEDALLAISSLMRGERDPIEKYGVSIKAVDVNARIAALGLDTSTAAARKNAEAVAGMDLLMEQTAKTQGQFARETDTFAGKQAILTAKLEDASAKMGELLLPMLAHLAGFIADVVVPAFEGLVGAIGFVTGPIGAVADAIGFMVDNSKKTIPELPRAVETAALETTEAAWTMMQGIYTAAVQGGEQVKPEYERIAKMPGSLVRAEYADIRNAAFQSMVEHAKGLLDGQNAPRVQFEALKQVQAETLDNAAQVAYYKGILNSEQLASGLADSRPAVNAQAQATRLAVENALKSFNAWSSGYNTGTSYGAGLNAAYGYVRTAAGSLAAATRSQIGINSEPEGADSPLRGITKWGGNIAKTLAQGIDGNLGVGRSAAGRLASALTPSMLGAGVGGAVGVNPGINISVVVQGDIRDREHANELGREIGNQLRLSQGRRFVAT